MHRRDIYKETHDCVFAIGRLNMDLSALTKTVNGTITNPIMLEGDDGVSRCVFEGSPFFRIGKDGKEEQIKQIEKNQMKNPKRRVLSLACSDGSKPNWLQLELWGSTAIYAHKYCKKGDLVAIVATKKVKTSQYNGKDEVIYSVSDLQLLATSKRR